MTIEVNFDRCVLPPFAHQKDGVKHLVRRKNAALFDEMGVGKTKQTIDAAQFLFEAGEIDTVFVLAPASVRGVWDGEEFGEIEKHSWVPRRKFRFDRTHTFPLKSESGKLDWILASYAFIRQKDELLSLIGALRQRRVLLVLDESSYIKSRKAQQTKATKAISRVVARRVLLNGTPIANNLLDLWSQFDILDPEAIDKMNFFQFRAKYVIMGGYLNKQVIGYRNPEHLTAKLSPWILRREKKDCLDLPDKLYTQLEVPIGPEAWRLYVEMREEMVAWLTEGSPSIASHAAVKATRLSQLTSGFLGGVDSEGKTLPAIPVDDAKQRALIEWLDIEPRGAVIIWCRFRPEIERVAEELSQSGKRVGKVVGGQSDTVRQEILNGFSRGDIDIIVGQPQAGGWGLNLTRAHTVVYLSNDYNLTSRLQSEDRVHRPGQRNNVLYVDFLAISPAGKKTIDHAVAKAVRAKKDLAAWTTADWRRALDGE